MFGEVVVVLDGLEADGLTVETEVVYRDRRRKNGLDCYDGVQGCCSVIVARALLTWNGMETSHVQEDSLPPRALGWKGWPVVSLYAPSTMPSPDLKIGTSETVSGAMVVVSYSKPRGV